MRRPTTLLTTAAVALIGLTALAGCGDTTGTSDDEAAGSADTAEPSDDMGGMGGVDCEANPGETVTVEIPEFVFSPDPVEVSACDSVVWSNTHTQAHTSTGKGDKAWSTGNVAAGEESDAVLFDEAGTYAYICALHPFMEGTVEVS
jgi:plastocyanin